MVLVVFSCSLDTLGQFNADVLLNRSLKCAIMKSTCQRAQEKMMPKTIMSLIANQVTTGAYVSK